MKYFTLLFLIFSTSFGIAQSKKNNYSIKWINTENGLKQLSVRYCVSDSNGFIWIGTELGLYRYDGSNLKEINEEKYPSLSKQRIIRLGKDKVTGKIYLQTSPEDYQYVIDHDKIERIDPKKLLGNAIFTFNNLCYTDSNPLIQKVLQNASLKSFITEYSSITFLTACTTKNFLYLPQHEHIVALDKNGLIKKIDFHSTSGLVLMQFGETILAADKGKITPILEGKIILKKIEVDDKIQCYLDRKLINLSDIEIFGTNNNYYLKYNGGIFQIKYSNNKITTKFLFKNPAEDITSISHLEKENLYLIGTRTQGMAILKPILFNSIVFKEKNLNKSINYCYSVVETIDKEWYSASGWTFNPINLTSKTDNFFIDFRNTRFILPYKNKFYIQAENGFWNIKNHKKDYDFNYPKSKNFNLVGFSGYTYHKGQLYLSEPNHIYFLKGINFVTDVALNKKISGKVINGICSVNNDLIIPTTKGVYSYSPNTKKIIVIKGLENVNARYIKPIKNADFWVGCYGEGLFLVSQNKVYKVTDNNIDITTAHGIEEDVMGNIWISTNNGLLKTNKLTAIKKILNNQSLDCYKFTTDDGLLTNEFNGGGTHPSMHTKKGIIGFPSMKGFVWFHPEQVPEQLFKGNILIDKILRDNKKTITSQNNQYNIPKDVEILTFNFSYGYYFNRENLTVAYRFEDQKDWTKIEGNSFQISRYKKGTHKLILRISTHGFDPKLAILKSFTLHFEARYYETLWFWNIIIILFLTFLYASYLLGKYFSKQREKELKEKIDEKTAQLQETVLELESSKNSINQSLKEKNILLKEVHHRVKNNLQLIISMLNIQARRKNYENIYDFLKKGETRISSMALIHQSLYQSDESLDKINFQLYAEDLVNSISQTFENTEDYIKIEVLAQNIILNLNTSIPLGLIVNELVTNSLKYAFPENQKGKITVAINRKKNNLFELIIEDNGIGFDIQKIEKKSFGLELIRLLANQLNGNVEFENSITTKHIITFQEINL